MALFRKVAQGILTVWRHAHDIHSGRDLVVGATHVLRRTISKEDVETFAKLCGDINPIHFESGSGPAIVHGALLNSLVSSVIGTKLPGPGTIVIAQTLRFPKPCFVGETVSVTVEVTDLRKIITCSYKITSVKDKKLVMDGEAKLMIKTP